MKKLFKILFYFIFMIGLVSAQDTNTTTTDDNSTTDGNGTIDGNITIELNEME